MQEAQYAAARAELDPLLKQRDRESTTRAVTAYAINLLGEACAPRPRSSGSLDAPAPQPTARSPHETV